MASLGRRDLGVRLHSTFFVEVTEFPAKGKKLKSKHFLTSSSWFSPAPSPDRVPGLVLSARNLFSRNRMDGKIVTKA